MPRSTRILLGSWISLALAAVGLAGCQNRAPSLRMLDSRAAYGADLEDEEVAIYQRSRRLQDSLALRSGPRVAKVYIYPHELPTRDYFWGGYVSLVVSGEEWIFETPEDASTPAAIREVAKPSTARDRAGKNRSNPARPGARETGSRD